MIGKRIGGRYEIIRGIGEGGMSKVYLAHDIILDRDVAIKVLDYDFANEEDLKRRFQREALSATSLTHPHIVNIFDVGEEDELHYLVMEYIDGRTLKKFIQSNGPLRPQQAVQIMKQLVSAIANAHHNGIIHRDIKPQNILMDQNGDVKITDFGIAMALNSTAHTKTNSVLGTVHYLSPEQARGGMATKKSDIYSLGIVFYELLTGELPFSAESAVAIALKHLQEETPSVRNRFPSIPQSVENVILKATAKDPLNRYRSADEMYEDLLTVLSPERADEEKFTEPLDDDKTRAIPIVNESQKFDHAEETKKLEPVQTPATELQEKKKKKKKKGPIIAGIVGGILLVVLLLLFLPGWLGPKKAIVPNVVGEEEKSAVETLEAEGFKVNEKIEENSDEVEAGKVIRTIPEGGKKRDVGTSIDVYISMGKETMVMADYRGQGYENVNSLLSERFKTVRSVTEFSDEPEGAIIGQTPAGGEEVVPEETDLVFTVSKGPELVTVRNLEGYTESELESYRKESGLVIKVVSEEYNETVPEKQVIRQTPSAGTQLRKGEAVKVVVSKGKEKLPTRSFFRTVTIPYEPRNDENSDEDGDEEEVSPKAQLVQIYIKDRKHSMDDVYEEFEIYEDTKKQFKVDLDEGQTGGYRIVRDNQIIENVTINYDDND
ncbi:Stk1 family PASTA domain-containing Ser/Thr kinase [Sporosarcina sp. Te-1]|uniref:Stk1 family PASTA domain-containing Ser/Thr kinase n=1 Tax=Sporosarcina sp. Te-1 TaxID=2818390 RepID=UPI001A9F6437|nr:Stk1 family PASTA domain-containing Ser/Thr kinase [Sporosarcina sp. Te-1]QTD42369.1 Stk1 family PASTA domain-containing Ser/Thr kinase [Sporosarcina sp. Te-1]